MYNRTNRHSVAALTTTALLTALMLVLSYTPLGFIPIGAISITIVHLPVLIGLMVQGLPTGLFLGTLFGVISLLRSLTPTGLLDPFFINPLISVLPRALIPLAAWGVYRLVLKALAGRKGAQHAAVAAGALCGSIVNTAGVLGMLYLLYGGSIAEAMGIAQGAVGGVLLTIAVTNGVPEAVVSMVLTPAVALAVNRAMHAGTRHNTRRMRAA